ncbi:g12297 [Coccomyxa viridis]|uniref:G12297 protein n=1 Tax=Coccomyxa viridis TaxID=1274662 RepID=A0ABP1GH13_9CHLO
MSGRLADVRTLVTDGSKVLRELYKRVHPDLFHDVPHAREANEHSFKLLQEYLEFAKKGGELGRTAGVPYKFRFFLYKQDGSEAEPAEQNGELKKVELILPPPARLDAGTAEGALPRSTQKALGRLFSACGLSADFTGGAEQDQPLNLRQFVPQAAELARQRQLSQRGPRHDISTLRTALRLGRQVTVGFAPSVRARGAVVQADLIRQVAAALDKVQHLDVRGLRFMLGQEYGVDAEGQLWLDASDNALFWSGYLTATDFSECHDRQATLKRIQLLEASVAASLGVSMVYSSPALRAKPGYYSLLERLAAEASELGAVAGGANRSVPLQVVEDKTSEDPGSQSGFSTDTDFGFLSVPVSAPAQHVYKHIEAHGLEVRRALAERRQQHDKAEDLRRALERRLRLRRLSKDPALSHERFCRACMRFLQRADALMPLMEGLEVRISEASMVSPDGAHIDIAWDCDI